MYYTYNTCKCGFLYSSIELEYALLMVRTVFLLLSIISGLPESDEIASYLFNGQ